MDGAGEVELELLYSGTPVTGTPGEPERRVRPKLLKETRFLKSTMKGSGLGSQLEAGRAKRERKHVNYCPVDPLRGVLKRSAKETTMPVTRRPDESSEAAAVHVNLKSPMDSAEPAKGGSSDSSPTLNDEAGASSGKKEKALGRKRGRATRSKRKLLAEVGLAKGPTATGSLADVYRSLDLFQLNNNDLGFKLEQERATAERERRLKEQATGKLSKMVKGVEDLNACFRAMEERRALLPARGHADLQEGVARIQAELERPPTRMAEEAQQVRLLVENFLVLIGKVQAAEAEAGAAEAKLAKACADVSALSGQVEQLARNMQQFSHSLALKN